LGISGVALGKACRRAAIPVPPKGYWAKLRYGKCVKKPSLPNARKGEQEELLFAARPKRVAAREQESLPEDLQKLAELAKALSFRVPASMSKLHPIVEVWVREQAAQRGAPGNRLKQTAFETRRRRILTVLFRSIDHLGGSVRFGSMEGSLVFFVTLAGEALEVSVKERQRQVERPLTDQERRHGF
jgi:hypothetical protein